MKIGIVTIYDFFNHGNRLQNYALEKAIENLIPGSTVQTLAISSKKIYATLLEIARPLVFVPIINRINRSRKHTKRKLNNMIIDHKSHKKLEEIAKEFDYFVIGSDQVWNPAYMADSFVSFMKFAEKEKCVAYAPSFGVEELPEKHIEEFKEGLLHIHKLSVREDEGAKLIKNLIGQEAQVVIDPTLLLTKEQWQEFAFETEVKKPKEKYILTYFLGACGEHKKRVNQLANQLGFKVININSMACKYHSANPQEFMALLAGAELVCTNSFHGHALSIVMEKPFISFAGFGKTKSRIRTLLSKFKLENRNYQKVDAKNCLQVDFEYAREKLKEERKSAFEFLRGALK